MSSGVGTVTRDQEADTALYRLQTIDYRLISPWSESPES